MTIRLPFKQFTDTDYVTGIQAGNPAMERKFYDHCRGYYEDVKHKLFGDDNVSHEDFFQDAFIQIWTEIQNRRIHLVDGSVYRIKADGTDGKMTARLTSFMVVIIKNQYLKTKRHKTVDIDNAGKADLMQIEELLQYDSADKELKHQLVDDCVADLPARCKEILTLFYFKKKSLDEILQIRRENTSKDGLKSAKSKCMRQLEGRIIESFGEFSISLC